METLQAEGTREDQMKGKGGAFWGLQNWAWRCFVSHSTELSSFRTTAADLKDPSPVNDMSPCSVYLSAWRL